MIRVRRTLRFIVSAVCLVALAGQPLTAQGLPAASPESVGLSSDRLERIDRVMREYVDEGRMAGTVALIARRGKIAHLQAYGQRDLEKHAPMQRDTIFRIASMSKAVTSIAALMLLEEGRLLLSDPVSKFIPAYKTTTVAVPPPAGAAPNSPVAVVPAKREITIRDLLTHTSGVSLRRRPRGGASTRPRTSGCGTSPTGTSPSCPSWSGSHRCRSTRSLGEMHLRVQHRHPGRGRREGIGHAARRVLPDAHLRAAQDGRHLVLPAAGEARSAGCRVRRQGRVGASSERRIQAAGRAITWTARASAFPAVRDCCRQPATMHVFSRCC